MLVRSIKLRNEQGPPSTSGTTRTSKRYCDSAFLDATVPIATVVVVVRASGPATAPLDWRMYAVIDVYESALSGELPGGIAVDMYWKRSFVLRERQPLMN